MPRYQKNRSVLKTHHEKRKEKQVDSTTPIRPSTEEEKIQNSSSENTSTSEAAEQLEGAVEVIHWIPATAGSVIQIPGGSQQISMIHEDGHAMDLQVFQSDTVNKLRAIK